MRVEATVTAASRGTQALVAPEIGIGLDCATLGGLSLIGNSRKSSREDAGFGSCAIAKAR
jgi:hypothetical protein